MENSLHRRSGLLQQSRIVKRIIDAGQWITRLRKPRVLILTGLTCSGKTELSLDLALRLNGEIISADSVQVYRGLDVGTSKISYSQRRGIPHHLIDIRHPSEDFSAGNFYAEARKATEEILAKGKVPIVVGGTGFYLKWFVHGPAKTCTSTAESKQRATERLNQAWINAEQQKRASLSDEEKWNVGIAVLKSFDEEAAQRVGAERNNYYRLKRAVEIALEDKELMSSLSVDINQSLDYDFRCFFLHRPRIEIYDRIEQRCELMVKDGLLEEAQELLDSGLLPNEKSATRSIGYRQAMEFLLRIKTGKLELNDGALIEFLTEFKSATRKLVKQQITWFRSQPHYCWIDPTYKCGSLEEQVLRKWSKLARHSRPDQISYTLVQLQCLVESLPVVLTRDEQNRLKRYAPRLHYFKEEKHRSELIERIKHLLQTNDTATTVTINTSAC